MCKLVMAEIKDSIKLIAKIIFQVKAIITIFLAFSVVYLISYNMFNNDGHIYMRLIIGVSFSLLAVHYVSYQILHKRKIIDQLCYLSPDEKEIIITMVKDKTQTTMLPYGDSIANCLENKGILVSASGTYQDSAGIPFTMPLWLFKHLLKNKNKD